LDAPASPPRFENPEVIFLIAARFQVPICVECTPYFFDSFAIVISLRIDSSATFALNLLHKLIHLNYRSEFSPPPLPRGDKPVEAG
jgi:hypothetical protein